MGETDQSRPRRINLGCGFDHRDGYLNVDFQEFHNPDLTADVKDLSALADASFDEALANDVLEHLERGDVVPALREWRRVLAPGGSLHLRTPDVVGIGASIARRDEVAFHHLMVQGVFGTQAYQGDYHQAGFTDLTLIDQLFEAGYDRILIGRLHGWMLEADARRPEGAAVNPIAIGLGPSVSPPELDGEAEWRWCERASEILLFAHADAPFDAHLELALFRPDDRTEIELVGSGLRRHEVVSGAATITCRLTLAPGANRLSMISHGPPIPAPGDPRKLHVQLLGINAVPAASAAA
jgi:SAM-dependent methyltransferase